MSHPGGVARRVELPVAALLVAQRTHDNVSSDLFVADFLAMGPNRGEDGNHNNENTTGDCAGCVSHLHWLSS